MQRDLRPIITMQPIKKLSDKYLASEVDGELILVHGDTGAFFAVKDVGLEIWRKLDQTSDLDAICEGLLREYEVSEGQCRKSVDRFAQELVDAGFAEFA